MLCYILPYPTSSKLRYLNALLVKPFTHQFKLRKYVLTLQKEKAEEVDDEACKESALPVLRLLRPEFRAQLAVAKRKSSSPVCSPNR